MTKSLLIIVSSVGIVGLSQAQAFDDFTGSNTMASGWNTDRANPNTFGLGTAPDGTQNTLDMGVVPDANSNVSFYAYEGKQKTANISGDFTVSGSVYLTADMLSNTNGDQYSTGLWTRDNNPDENSAWYGIMQFRNNTSTGGNGGFYFWDGVAGSWDAVGGSLSANSWYNLSMQEVGSTMDYFINGNLVESYANASAGTGLQSVFLEDYNFGQTSDVFWKDVSATPSGTPEPAAMAAMWGSAVPFVVGAIRRRRRAKA